MSIDSYVLDTSSKGFKGKNIVFSKKHWIPTVDSQGNSYVANKVMFNLKEHANSGESYFNPAESFITIPLNIAVEFYNSASTVSLLAGDKGNAGTTDNENAFVASLKNGSYHIIDRINYKLNGNEVIPQDTYENLKIHYNIVSKWSHDDEVKHGDELHFAKDTGDSHYFHTVYGASNNIIADALFSPTSGYNKRPNKGRIDRMRRTSFNNQATETIKFYGGTTDALVLAGISTDRVSTIYKDYVEIGANVAGTASAKKTINYHILATIKLGDLHPFFESMPLCKNVDQILTLYLNTNMVHTHTIAAGLMTAVAVTSPSSCCPYQISVPSTTAGTGCHTVAALGGNIKSSISVNRVPSNIIAGSSAHPQNQCIFHSCFVELTSEARGTYMSDEIKPVVWNDCYCQSGGTLAGVAKSARVNQLISGSFSKVRKIVIMPFISGVNNGTAQISPLLSTFASEPATLSMYTGNNATADMNVRLGVNNIYPKNIQYSYENYLESAQADGAINGGLQKGMSNGLLSQNDWESSYSYRVIDLSRKSKVEDLPEQQISVTFRNDSAFVMDYFVMVYYEKTLLLDTEKGLIAN